MHKYISWKPLSFLAVCLSIGLSAMAEPYKLYINKHDSAQNVVLLENELSATVKHTAEGMEITLQGVEISMRCRGNSSSTDGCTIAIEPGSTTTTTTTGGGGSTDTSGGSSGSGTTTNTSGGDGCADGTSTWASGDCDDSGSSSSSDSGSSDSGSSGSGSSGSGSSDSGSSSTGGCGSGVVCSTRDFGALTSVGQELYEFRSSIYAFPMSPPNLTGTASVRWTPSASTPANTDGSSLRMWLSKEAGGVPLGSSKACGAEQSLLASFYYTYGSGDCPLSPSTKYWMNFAYCPGNASTDLRCLNSPSPAQQLKLYIVP